VLRDSVPRLLFRGGMTPNARQPAIPMAEAQRTAELGARNQEGLKRLSLPG
jgi:hypothetical protein